MIPLGSSPPTNGLKTAQSQQRDRPNHASNVARLEDAVSLNIFRRQQQQQQQQHSAGAVCRAVR